MPHPEEMLDQDGSPEPAPRASTRRASARRAGAAFGRTAATAFIGGRDTIRSNRVANSAYRAGVGVVGGATVALGVALMPLPGPGTLISIGGLGILATEFKGAKKVQDKAIGIAKRAVGAAKGASASRAKRQPSTPPDSRK